MRFLPAGALRQLFQPPRGWWWAVLVSDVSCGFNWRCEHLYLGPLELDHVKQRVISQLRCVFFPKKGLELPNKQGTKTAQVVPSAALAVTPAT